MSVIFTGINKRYIKVFLTKNKTKNKTTTKQIAASTLWQGYCFWLSDLISFMKDIFDICFTDYRPTSYLQQFKYGQKLFGKYRKSLFGT